jgi:5-formyltetrahydrofolate cyclo-ligase
MPETTSSKAQLRTQLRRRRHALGPEKQHLAGQSVARHISGLPGWPDATRIATYLAADDELDTTPISEMCRDLGKQLFLPVIQPDQSLLFAQWSPEHTLHRNRYDIPEPPADALRCPAQELDIILLPLVGWDEQGGRLGMGGGFYDRTMAGIHGPRLVGLGHSCQQVDHVPREAWDISLDFIATDTALYDCQGTN